MSMDPSESDRVAELRSVLDRALADPDRDRTGTGPRIYRDGDPLPPAAQAALDRRDPTELDRRWREATGQA